MSWNSEYTIDHIKSAFNAGKRFETYEDWVRWSINEIDKIKTSDPYVLADLFINVGGKYLEKDSNHHIVIDLSWRIDPDQCRSDVSKILNSELFIHRGLAHVGERYISRKYDNMEIGYDRSTGIISIFHSYPITKEQAKRDGKIRSINT